MSFESPLFSPGMIVAAADLSAKQFTGVKMSSTGVAAVAASTDIPMGILQNKPTAGQAAQVMTAGISKAVCGAAVTAGAEVMFNASGQVITAVTATNQVVGIALETSTALGQIIAVLLGRQRII